MLTQANTYTFSFPFALILVLTLHIHFHVFGLGAALQPTNAIETQRVPGYVYKMDGGQEADFRQTTTP